MSVAIDLVARTTSQTDWAARAAAIAEEIAAEAALHDADDSFVAAGYARLKAEGFFKALVPAELGGGGASVGEMCQAIRILGAACGSTALAFAMHSHLVAVNAWRRQHQNAPTEGMLKRVAAEDLVLVSSGGSDWLPSGGVAEKVEGGFKITARKPFSSGSPMGDLLVTSAVYQDPEAGPTVLHFAVPLKAEGVTLLDTWKALGMRGTGSHDIALEGVFVAEAAISGRRPAGKWHPLFHAIGMIAFALIYSAYVGVAEGARDKAVTACRGKPQDALTALAIGEIETAMLATELAWDELVRLAEDGTPGPETTSRAMACRTLAARGAIAVVEKALEAVGGRGFYRDFGLERAFRDVQGARFHPLPEKPQAKLTGQVALGWDIDG